MTRARAARQILRSSNTNEYWMRLMEDGRTGGASQFHTHTTTHARQVEVQLKSSHHASHTLKARVLPHNGCTAVNATGAQAPSQAAPAAPVGAPAAPERARLLKREKKREFAGLDKFLHATRWEAGFS